MKIPGAILFLIFGILLCAQTARAHDVNLAPSLTADTIEDAQWRNRIIVTCSKSEPGGDVSFGAAYIDGIDRAGFIDRDILILHVLQKPRSGILAIAPTQQPQMKILKDEDQVAHVVKRAKCKSDKNAVALIGKDGQLKKVWRGRGPSNAELFGLIDAMPMRKMEMRERQQTSRTPD